MLNLCYPPLYVRPKRSYYYKNHTIILQAGTMRLSSFFSKRICFVTNYVTLIVTFAHPLNNLMCQQLTSITITLDVILPFFWVQQATTKILKFMPKILLPLLQIRTTLCAYTRTLATARLHTKRTFICGTDANCAPHLDALWAY